MAESSERSLDRPERSRGLRVINIIMLAASIVTFVFLLGCTLPWHLGHYRGDIPVMTWLRLELPVWAWRAAGRICSGIPTIAAELLLLAVGFAVEKGPFQTRVRSDLVRLPRLGILLGILIYCLWLVRPWWVFYGSASSWGL